MRWFGAVRSCGEATPVLDLRLSGDRTRHRVQVPSLWQSRPTAKDKTAIIVIGRKRATREVGDRSMTVAAKAYITFIIALGAAAAVRGYLLWNPHDLVRFCWYLALAVPASCLKVRLPGVLGTMSVLFVFQLAAIVELGLSETLIMSAVCVIVQSYWRPKSKPLLVHVAFSVALMFVVSTAGDFAYHFDGLPFVHS